MRRVTIADVAKKAGVSPTAVSFAFNKPDQLNGETTNRIRKVAIELGYMPNPLARALISRRVGVLGVLMPQPLGAVLANAYFHTFLQGISSMCDEERLSILSVSPLNGSLDHAFTNAPVDGFIIVGFNESHHEVMAAVDAALHKVQAQLRRYKEKIQDHRRTPSVGDVAGGPGDVDPEE